MGVEVFSGVGNVAASLSGLMASRIFKGSLLHAMSYAYIG